MLRPSLVLLFLAACGAGSDAAAPPDAGPPDSAAGTATVETDTVCCLGPLVPIGTPVGGIDLVVEDPDGTTDSTVTSGAGRATITVAPGASVTAIYRFAQGQVAYLYTFTSVQPGDHLRFGDAPQDVAFAPTESMQVSFPALAGASGYRVISRCGDNYVDAPILQTTFDHTAVCDVATDDLYLYAYVDHTLAAHAVLHGVTFQAGGSVALDAWTPTSDLAVEVTGLPADATDAFLSVTAIGGGHPLDSAFIEAAPSNGALSHTFAWTSDGDGMVAGATVSAPSGIQQRTVPFAAGAATETIADPIGLPWISDRQVDLVARTLSYTLDADQTGDLSLGIVSYATDEFPSGVYWHLYAPPGHAGANTLALPDVPSDVDPQTAITADGWIELRDFDAVDGYDAARGYATWQLEQDLLLQGGHVSQPGA